MNIERRGNHKKINKQECALLAAAIFYESNYVE